MFKGLSRSFVVVFLRGALLEWDRSGSFGGRSWEMAVAVLAGGHGESLRVCVTTQPVLETRLLIPYLLKTQLFNFLGNMGYMSVKD